VLCWVCESVACWPGCWPIENRRFANYCYSVGVATHLDCAASIHRRLGSSQPPYSEHGPNPTCCETDTTPCLRSFLIFLLWFCTKSYQVNSTLAFFVYNIISNLFKDQLGLYAWHYTVWCFHLQHFSIWRIFNKNSSLNIITTIKLRGRRWMSQYHVW
jgi:hypothetical protein